MSRRRAGHLARGTRPGTAPRRVFPRDLQRPSRADAGGGGASSPLLHPPVSRRAGDTPGNRRRPAASGGAARRPDGSAHLGAESGTAPTRPRDRAGGRAGARRHPLGVLPAGLLPPRAGPQPPAARQTPGSVPAIAPGTGASRAGSLWRIRSPLRSRRRRAPLSPLRAGSSGTGLANPAAPCAGTGGKHLSTASLRQLVMTAMPASPMRFWLPGALSRVALNARLPRESRLNIRHDRHQPRSGATLFLDPLQRPTCRTLPNTTGTALVLNVSPIQPP